MKHVTIEEVLSEMETCKVAYNQNQKEKIEISKKYNEASRLGKLE